MASLVITEQGNLIPQQPGEQSSQKCLLLPAGEERTEFSSQASQPPSAYAFIALKPTCSNVYTSLYAARESQKTLCLMHIFIDQ